MTKLMFNFCMPWNKDIIRSEYEEIQYKIKEQRTYLNNEFIKRFNLHKKYAGVNGVSPSGKTITEMTIIGFNVIDKIILRIQDLYIDIELAVIKREIDSLTGRYFRSIVDNIIQETIDWKNINLTNYYD